jgi:phage terminase small subunit
MPKKPKPSKQKPPQSPPNAPQSAADETQATQTPDSPLTNIRQERFCQEMALIYQTGKGTQGEAYQKAGYDCENVNVASSAAGRLLKDVEIIERIDCIRAAAVDAAKITPEKIAQELARIGFSDIRGIVKWQSNVTKIAEDPDTGEPTMRAFNEVALIDAVNLTEAQAAAIAEISQSKDGSIKIKLHNKLQALSTLAKWRGMVVDKVEHSGSVTLESLIAASMQPAKPEEKQ